MRSIFLKSFLQCFQTIFYDSFILVCDALSVQVILHSVNWASGTKGLSLSKTATRATQLHVCPAPDGSSFLDLDNASQTKQFADHQSLASPTRPSRTQEMPKERNALQNVHRLQK